MFYGLVKCQRRYVLFLCADGVKVDTLFLEYLFAVFGFRVAVSLFAFFNTGESGIELVERVVGTRIYYAQAVIGQHRIAFYRFFEQVLGFEIVVYVQGLESLVQPAGRERGR